MGFLGLHLPKKVDNVFGGIVAQANPFDNGRTYNTVRQNQAPPQALVNGRPASVLQQATHNGFTNAVGNLAVKPFVVNPIQIGSEAIREASAIGTRNKLALDAANARQKQNLSASIPGFIVDQAKNYGTVAQNLPRAVMADIHGFQGKMPTADEQQALNKGLKAFDKTTLGQMVSPVQDQINRVIPGAKQASKEAGYNVDGTFAQKYVADPLMGAVGTVGLLKGGVGAVKGAKAMGEATTNLINNPGAGRFAKIVQEQTLNSLRNQAAAEAASNVKTSSGMKALNLAEGGANFQKATAPPGVPLLEAPKQNFTITRLENQRIADGTEQLAKEYNTRYDALVKQWGQSRVGSARLASEVEKLDQEFQGRHDNLLNAQGEFTPKTPAVTVSKSGKPPTSLPKTAPTSGEVPKVSVKAAPTVVEGLAPEQPYTGAPKSSNAFNRAWKTVNGFISEHGTGGREVARRNAEARNQSEVRQQAFLNTIPTVNKLNKKDFTTFVQTLDKLDKGEQVNVSPKVSQAVKEWQASIQSIRDQATKSGLDVGDLGPNYFPRFYKDIYSQKGMGRLAEQISKEKGISVGEAMGQLQFMKNEYQRPFGNLEKTRSLDMPGYEQTHEALSNYIARSFDRITKAEQFGAKNEILNELQGRMQQEGYNAGPGSTIDKYIKIALGDVDHTTPGNKVSSGIRKFNALRSLGTAGISNATQLPVNTGTIAGVARTLKGAAQTLAPTKGGKEARSYAKDTGVLLDHSMSTLAEQSQGVSGPIMRNIASPFFKTIEKFNRAATAVVGRDYGNALAKKGDTTQLREKFGVTGDIGKTLTPEQEVQVSRKLVEMAQFKVDPQDLPAWVDSPTGKVISQFRTFGYKQTGFMYNYVLREAVKGNFLPLGRFVATGATAGTAALVAKGAIKGVPTINQQDSNGIKALKGVSQVGGFGLPGSEGLNLLNSAKYDNLPGGIAGTVGGPTASFTVQTANNIQKGVKGNWRPLEKQGVASIPTAGPAIANRAFPKKETSFDKSAKASQDTGLQTQKQLETSNPQGYTLQQVINNKGNKTYAYTLNDGNGVQYAKDLNTARTAIAKSGFKDEQGTYKVIGNKVYRKNADGTVGTPISKDSFDYRIGTATLTHQKRTGDLVGWTATANSQLDLIQKQLNNPNVDPLDAITLQNQAESLMSDMQKYGGYGGFKKGGGSGRSSGVSSGVRVSSRKVTSPYKKISVAKTRNLTPKSSSVRVSVRSRSKPLKSGSISVSSKKLRIA